MPERAYPNAICADGHIEVDHERLCLRCDKPLMATDLVAVHVTRNPRSREGGEASHPDDIATEGEWGKGNYQ